MPQVQGVKKRECPSALIISPRSLGLGADSAGSVAVWYGCVYPQRAPSPTIALGFCRVHVSKAHNWKWATSQSLHVLMNRSIHWALCWSRESRVPVCGSGLRTQEATFAPLRWEGKGPWVLTFRQPHWHSFFYQRDPVHH